jgi:hypothetical protein
MSISIGQLRLLCRSLDISPSALFRAEEDIVASPEEFVVRLATHLERTGQSARDFSNAIGWDVEQLLSNPGQVAHLNGDGLKAICEAIGLDWLPTLDEMRLSP